MFSPFSIELKTKFQTTEKEIYYMINHIKSFIEKKKGENIIATENSVSFTSAFFGWTWDTFSQLDNGIFSIDNNELIFKFYIIKTYIFFGLFCSLIAYESHNIIIPIVIFITAMTINWLTAKVKYETLLRELSNELNKRKNQADI